VKFRGVGVVLVLVCALALPATAGAFTSVPAFRSALQRRINHFRAEYHLRPIHLNLRLEHSAQAHSADMASHHDFSHSGSSGVSWIARIRYWGYHGDWIGENLAVGGNVTARTVMAMWKASPPHRANLLRSAFAAVGIGASPGTYSGRAAVYITSDFGG
jgi:uncharacterized protein YkwD